jgi:ribosomal protein S17
MTVNQHRIANCRLSVLTGSAVKEKEVRTVGVFLERKKGIRKLRRKEHNMLKKL